ncbi:MAG: response regulator [Acidobacteriota bacterium]|nr:response regulator [Acidobacteriota bacterium]
MPPRILVVEDHDDTRHLMAALLGARGYGVETAGGYGEGLRLAGDGSYDLILLDYGYADGTGTELCRRIRESDRDTPILFFSGVDPKLQREALSCGAQGFVLKPNFDDLWGEVSRALRRAALRSAGRRSSDC